MITSTVKFKGHLCFRDYWSGFTDLKPINVIVGRNNSGKSQLLDFVETLCATTLYHPNYMYQCSGILDEDSLRHRFPPNTSGGALGGNHWTKHGSQLVGSRIEWEVDHHLAPRITEIDHKELLTPARKEVLSTVVQAPQHRLSGTRFRRLLADRDIRPEQESIEMDLRPDGGGASNVIRRLLLSSNPELSRDLIRRDLRKALNQVFQEDGHFSEIQVNIHDETDNSALSDRWEIYLAEDTKGLIPLSKSGSGLKTVTLVLLHLIALPKIEQRKLSQYTFAFEELENNLHPALLRRLFQFVESFAVERDTHVFMSTHSSIALDLFGGSKNAQIVHVIHDGRSARTVTVAAHFDRVGVVAELGAKPSDLLQANGVVWVEGPSDRIYVNHWIALCSEGRLREGVHYQCAYFGGSLLARVTFDSEQASQQEMLANLLRVNPNVVVICDSDRTRKGARLKERVRRVRKEVQRLESGHIWITGAKEVENYIPGAVLSVVFDQHDLPDPQQYMNFYPRRGAKHKAYVTAHLRGRSMDKVKLAALSVQHMEREDMRMRFDWELEMKKVVKRIEAWNR